MQRTGKIQQIKARGFKKSSELSIGKHLLAIWGGGIVVWPLLAVLFMSAINAPGSERLMLAIIVLIINIFGGWLLALLVWAMNWGIRGWIETARSFKAARKQAQAQNEADMMAELPAPNASAQSVGEDELARQWRAMNPFGCCMDHRDAEGYPCHGGQDCQHPEFADR